MSAFDEILSALDDPATSKLEDRIAELEAENTNLKSLLEQSWSDRFSQLNHPDLWAQVEQSLWGG